MELFQTILVILIVAVATFYTGRSFYRQFRGKSGCSSGCSSSCQKPTEQKQDDFEV